MEYKDIVLIVLVVGMLFMATKVYKNNNIENFAPDQVELIKEEINRQYNMDIEAIRNLGAISKSLLTGTNYHSTEPANPGTLTIPADTVIEGNTVLKGKLKVDGELDFTNRNTILMNILPTGMVIAWAKQEIPKGWAVCDGENTTPDLRGRFVLAAGEGKELTTRALGDNNGEEQHTLTVDEMPNHGHKYTAPIWKYGGCGRDCSQGIGGGLFTTETIGGSQQHNNMPPFYVLIYIMKL